MPVAFLGALLLLAARTCSTEAASVTLTFDVGDAPVTSIRADLYRGDAADSVGYFESSRVDANGIAGVWELTADAGEYRIQVEARLGERLVELRRTIELRDRAQVTLKLERDLK